MHKGDAMNALHRFDTMTDAELCALTDEQISYYMDLACAEAGVPLMPPDPGAVPTEPERKHDVTLWKVGDFLFSSADDAAAVANLVNGLARMKKEYARGGSYRDQVARSSSEAVAVEQERCYSPSAWDAQRISVVERQKAIEDYEERRKEYQNASEKRSETAGYVHERISEARNREWERKRFGAQMERYTVLAGGDERMAYKFLLAAHPEASNFVTEPPVEDEAPMGVAE